MKNILKTKIKANDIGSLEVLLSFIILNSQKKDQEGKNDKKLITYKSLNRPVDLKEAIDNLYEKLKHNHAFEKYFCNDSLNEELKKTILIKILHFAFSNGMEINNKLVEKFLSKNTIPLSKAKVRATFILQKYANDGYIPNKSID